MFLRLCATLLIACTVVGAKADSRDLTRLRTIGYPGGDSIYIFTSATCPHCATFHRDVLPSLINKYATTGKAQIFFVDDSAATPAIEASMLARCMPEEKSEPFMTKVFENQREWSQTKNATDKLIKYATSLGLTRKEAQQCLANSDLRVTMRDQWANLSNLYHILFLPTVAFRRGNEVKTYTGANRTAVLNGIAHDFPQ